MLEEISYIEQIIEFFKGPPDEVVISLLLWFGWIPVVAMMLKAAIMIFVDNRQGKWLETQPYVMLAIDVPRDSEQSPKAVENLFATLGAAKMGPNFKEKYFEGKHQRGFSFEIVSIDGYVQYYIRTHVRYRDLIESAIYAQYPDAEIREAEDYVDNVPVDYPDEDYDMHGTEYTLDKPGYLPIKTWTHFEHSLTQELKDPLAIMLEGLTKLKPGEQIWLQIVLKPISQGWKKAGDSYIKDLFGIKEDVKTSTVEAIARGLISVPKAIVNDAFGIEAVESEKKQDDDMWKAFKVTEQEREVAKAVVNKISKIGFETKIRYVYVARREVFKKGPRGDLIKGIFKQYTHLDQNGLGKAGTVTPKDDYFWQKWGYIPRQNKLIKAYKKRSYAIGAAPSILNTEELATIYHFPTIEFKVPLIKKTVSKRGEPPSALTFATEDEEQEFTPKTEDSIDLESNEPLDEFTESIEELVRPDMGAVQSPTGGIVEPTINPKPVSAAKPAPAQSSSNKKIPDAIRILLDPTVELEDTDIKTPPSKGDEDQAPPNLPI